MAIHTIIIRTALAIIVVANLHEIGEETVAATVPSSPSASTPEFTETLTDEMIHWCKEVASFGGHYSESIMNGCLQQELTAKKANQKLINNRD